MEILPYDDTNPISIEEYSQKLIGKTFSDVLENEIKNEEELNKLKDYYNNPRSKGGLGNLIEKYYFFYEPNNNPEPDFPKAGVELKVTPYEQLKNKKYRAGERLVIGMISNEDPIESNFDKSHVLDKLQLVLLVLYLRKKESDRIDFQINYSKLYSILGEACKEDLEIIKSDYKIITDKIKMGLAHELSEADTMYLGACTKGSTAEKSLQPQFYNDTVKAKRRAFSLKQGYMTYVLNKYIFNDVDTYEKISKNKNITKEAFEKEVILKINRFRDWTESDLRKNFNMEKDKSKDIFSRLSFAMLGVTSNNAEEFIKSDTVVKTIRIEEDGKIKESMSFPTINFKEFVKEEWEDSNIYNYFSEKRFLFIIYIKRNGEYVLTKSMFWNMPLKDLETIGKKEWLENQRIIKNNVTLTPKNRKVINNLPKASKTQIFHLRPHAKNSVYLINGKKYGNGRLDKDADELPNGDMMVTQSFWLNKNYILKQINK